VFKILYLIHYYTHTLLSSVLWHCSLEARNSIRPVKNWVMRSWHGCLSAVRCTWFACGPDYATATPLSLPWLKSRMVFTFLVPAYPGCSAREAIKRVSTCCLSTISHNDKCRPLDVISLSEHYVVAVRSVDIKVDLSNVRRPAVRSTLHLLQYTQQHCHQQLSLLSQQGTWKLTAKGSDTLESFLSKVAFESNLRKKLSRTEHVLIVKVSFDRRKKCESFHDTRASFLSKVTFESDFRKKTF